MLRISGDVILGTATRFRTALEEATDAVEQTEGSEHVLVVDLRETDFMDSIGLSTLIEGTRRLRLAGGEARLVVHPSGPVMRLLEVTGIVDAFRVYPEVLPATEEFQAMKAERKGRIERLYESFLELSVPGVWLLLWLAGVLLLSLCAAALYLYWLLL